MPITSSLRVLRERWKTASTVFVIVVLAAVAVTVLVPKSYTATAQVLVTAKVRGDGSVRAQANNYVQTQVPSYARVIDAPDVIAYIRSSLDPDVSDSVVRSELSASAETGSSIIDIVVVDGSATRARDLANSGARGFVAAIERYDSSTRLFLTGPAQRPSTPTSPQLALDIVIGVLLGLVLAAISAGLRAAFDSRLRSPEAVAAAANSRLLAVIPDDSRAQRFPVAAADPDPSARANAFRQLRTSVIHATADGGRVIVVAGPQKGTGTTGVSLNLARTLAEAGHRVCLVETSVQRPSLASILTLEDAPGLTEVLQHGTDPLSALQDMGDGLHVLTAGSPTPRRSGLLASSAAVVAVRSLAEFADHVVVDASPLLPTADGSQVASLADTAILVTKYGATSRDDVARARDALSQVDADLLGVVFNRVPHRRRSDRRGYGYQRDIVSDEPSSGRHAGSASRRSRESNGFTQLGGSTS